MEWSSYKVTSFALSGLAIVLPPCSLLFLCCVVFDFSSDLHHYPQLISFNSTHSFVTYSLLNSPCLPLLSVPFVARQTLSDQHLFSSPESGNHHFDQHVLLWLITQPSLDYNRGY